jgi:acetylornithine deacetylase/succinyl-diaminopimelate desuccinylase-like protein
VRDLLIVNSILTAHGPNEFVEKADLLEAVEGYKKLILRALK